MIFGPSDAEFHVELDGIKKCLHQKWPKQRDSNRRPDFEGKKLNLLLVLWPFQWQNLEKISYQKNDMGVIFHLIPLESVKVYYFGHNTSIHPYQELFQPMR